MKEELFKLLDGELPDDATAELMHKLSVDPDKRQVFRQQLKLQGALYRNDGHGSLTPMEEVEMLQRLGSVVETGAGSSVRKFRPGIIGLLAGAIVFGSGIGYVAGSYGKPGSVSSAKSPQQMQTVERPVQAAPNVASPSSVVSPPSFNRDSLISSVKDSLLKSQKVVSSPSVTEPQTPTHKRLAVRKSHVRHFDGNDLTGAPEAKRMARKHRNSR